MKIADGIAELKAARPPWDDLLERRVLAGVHRDHARRSARRANVRHGGAIAAMLALAVGLGAWLSGDRDEVAVTLTAIEPLHSEPAPFEAETSAPPIELDARETAGSVLALADGSRVDLDEGTRLETLVQTDAVVRLAQQSGRARYEVEDDPDRSLVVEAGAYHVRVTAAVFVLEVAAERVHVHVQSGAVEIEDGERKIPLAAGDRVELSAAGAAERSDAVEGTPAAPRLRTTPDDIDAMLDEADAARRAGRLADAATLLRRIATTSGADARAPSTWFMLGRVERRRGRHDAAAQAFRRAGKAAKSDALAEDALAEEAASWHDAGQPAKAASAAERYLQRWPSGTHAKRVRAIVR